LGRERLCGFQNSGKGFWNLSEKYRGVFRSQLLQRGVFSFRLLQDEDVVAAVVMAKKKNYGSCKSSA
jgi:hypothetical protein